MNSGEMVAIEVKQIRVLNANEKGAIREALEHYIAAYPLPRKHFVQKIILEEMLDVLMWGSK